MLGETSRRVLLVIWLHLAVLWALAVAQPLLDVLGDTPEFFVARGNTRGDIVLLAFALVLLPPTALWLVELVLGRWRRIRLTVHLVFVALLTAVLAVQVVKDVAPGLPAAAAIVLSLVLGAGAAALYALRSGVRSFVTVLSPAPALFLALFLLVSPVSDLVLPQDDVAAAGSRGGGAPVVMLVFDEFSGASLLGSDGRIDAVRYPNFARLASGSTWYPNATTVDFATERAVPAVMTGVQPESDSLPIAADHPHSIFTMLGARYRFHVQEPATELCPESLCGKRVRKARSERLRSLADDLGVVTLHLVAPGGIEDDLPAVDNTFEGFGGGDDQPNTASGTRSGIPASAFEDRSRQFGRFLGRMGQDSGSPTLDFLHVALPHWPWQFLPSGQQYPSATERIPGLNGSTWGRDPALAAQGYQRYLLQLGYVDSLIGRLIDRLRATGLWDDAVVVVTADHGVSYRAGEPRRIPTRTNLPDIASVPLFVKEPGRPAGRVDRSPVRTIDVLPTIAGAIGLRTGWSFDGRSVDGDATERTTVDVRSGEDVSMGVARFERARDAEVRRRIGLFGEGDRGTGIFAAGAERLVGRAVAGLGAPPAPGLQGELDDQALLNDVRPSSGVVPALVRGRISGPLEPGSRIAIALNGSIRAIAAAYEDSGELRFGAMVPASAFRRGRNKVALFRVGGDGPEASLGAIAVHGGSLPSGRLAEGGTRLELAGGRSLAVAAGAVTGVVEDAKAPDPAQLVVAGWAADPRKRRHVPRVLVFADGRLVGSARPATPRVDVVAAHGRPALYSGYRVALSLPDADAVAGDSSRLRVFAVLGGRASELKRLGG